MKLETVYRNFSKIELLLVLALIILSGSATLFPRIPEKVGFTVGCYALGQSGKRIVVLESSEDKEKFKSTGACYWIVECGIEKSPSLTPRQVVLGGFLEYRNLVLIAFGKESHRNDGAPVPSNIDNSEWNEVVDAIEMKWGRPLVQLSGNQFQGVVPFISYRKLCVLLSVCIGVILLARMCQKGWWKLLIQREMLNAKRLKNR